jgi:hypothetical protein
MSSDVGIVTGYKGGFLDLGQGHIEQTLFGDEIILGRHIVIVGFNGPLKGAMALLAAMKT